MGFWLSSVFVRLTLDIDRKEMSTSGRMVSLRDLFSPDDHLKGEHTVRMSPTG